jgi:outer membrane immunogenic protein
MRKFLFVMALAPFFLTNAQAADLPARTYAKAPPMAPAFTWTGCYVGVTGGAAEGHSQWTSISTAIPRLRGLPVANHKMNDVALGGTVGCNYQMSAVVFGVEGDLSWTNLQSAGRAKPPFGGFVETKQGWFGTLRARLGYSVAERWLVYVTGGLATTSAQLRVFDNATFNVVDSKSRTGWTLGAGIEVAFDNHWSAKFEYLHMDFGNAKYFNPDVPIPGGVVVAERNRLTNDIIRVGLNYRFY